MRNLIRRIGLLKLIVLCASAAVGLLIVEFGARLVVCEPLGLFQPSSRLGYVMAANYRGCHKKFSEFDTTIETNSRGHRDGEDRGRQDAPRILVVGDSVTFGFGVEGPETFAERLESLLRGSLGRPVEVINTGVWGYNLLQISRYVDSGAENYEPDLVVVGLTSPLMIVRNWRSHLIGSVTVEPLRNESDGIFGRMRGFAKRHSHVYSFLDRRWQYNRKVVPTLADIRRLLGMTEARDADAGAGGAAPVAAMPDSLPPDLPLKDAMALTSQLMENIRARNDARGVRTVVALLPDLIQVLEAIHNPTPQTRSRELNHLLIEELKTRGLDVIDLTGPLAERAEQDALYLPHDTTHLTAAGHQVVAEALHRRLVDEQRLPFDDARGAAPAGR